MTPLKICIMYNRVDERHLREIERIAPGARVVRAGRDDQAAALRDAHISFGAFPPDLVEQAPLLKWIHLTSAGADRFVRSPVVRERGITITNSSGCFGIPISEHVFALMLGLTRGLGRLVRAQVRSAWERPPFLGELHGATLGILGLGDIGTEVARRAKAFGMRVIAMKRRPAERPSFVDELWGPEGTDRVVREADVLVLCLPGTEATRGILSRERIRSMKRGAYVVNIGRGSLIDESALIEALASGHLAGAGLDVFAEEPLPSSSPLWHMENVIITPHTAGNSPNHPERTTAIFLRNLERFVRNEPLENVVDLDWGY